MMKRTKQTPESDAYQAIMNRNVYVEFKNYSLKGS